MLTETVPAVTELSIDGSADVTPELVASVHAFCDRVEDGGPAAVAVLRLSGSADPRPELDVATVNKWERALRRVERLGAATVAVVSGDCGGLALEALLTTDHRIAMANTRLWVPVLGGTVWPGMVLYRLANQVGVAAMRRVVIFREPLAAEEAKALGLLDRVVAPEAIADALAAVPQAGPDVAVRRQLMLEATTSNFEDALGRHLAACDRTLRQGRTGTEAAG